MKTHFVTFLACYSKQMKAFINMKQFFFGKIRYLFLTYQKFVMVFCFIFSKYFFENMGFLYPPSIQWPMEAYSNGSKKQKFMTQSLNCVFLYTVCFGIIIVSLNTTFDHFFMYTPRFHKMFGHGNLV